MKKNFNDGHVLPRPVEPLPDYAHAKARQTLAEKLIEAFKLSPEAATATANGVVDPTHVRKEIGEPTEPQTEEIPIPGGTILGIRTQVWARRIMPDPRNPRIGPSRRHPFAVDPGTGDERAKFRPVPEPRTPDGMSSTIAELVVDIENRHHLVWAAQQAARFVLAENDWSQSIASQGVMEAVWLVPTTYLHGDGSASVTTLTTVEGSSRTTAVHSLLAIVSADVPYEENDTKLRNYYRKLNESLTGTPSIEEATALRCERVPALILVGFRPHPTGTTGFPTAVKSLVALRHVDPPKPWGEGPENESLADEVLDELQRQGLISQTQRDYYAGSCTRAEAKAAHLSDDPAVRASAIVGLFTSDDDRINQAIRVAVTSQSTRKRISQKMCNDLATALILRALADDPARTDQIRRYMRHAFGKSVHKENWSATDRDTDRLVDASLAEVRKAIGAGVEGEPGPASLELAVRAAYPLVVSGRLNADRGSANNDQPDRRTPGEVLDAMRQSVQGVWQLGQALRDFPTEPAIRAVDEDGEVKRLGDDSGDQAISDVYLRQEFPPPGKVRARRPGNIPADVLKNRLADFSDAMEALNDAYAAIGKVMGDDGRLLVDSQGVDVKLCIDWRQRLTQISDDLNFWGRTFSKTVGTAPAPTVDDEDFYDDTANADDSDPYDDGEDADIRDDDAA
ncbi:MAG TPA: hypothetical protein VFI31_03500 [Pirellulales bacterium]|nr:hypothetical protein [Pirellulales bacterium]